MPAAPSPPQPSPELARTLDRTLYTYAELIDGRDFVGLHRVFAENARIDYRQTGGPEASLREAVGFLETEMRRFRVLQHFISNIRYATSAQGWQSRCYVLAKHGFKREGVAGLVFFELGGEYEDRWVETEAGWRIEHRVLHMRFVEGATQ